MKRAAFAPLAAAFTLMVAATALAQTDARSSSAELAERTIHRRAVEAVNE